MRKRVLNGLIVGLLVLVLALVTTGCGQGSDEVESNKAEGPTKEKPMILKFSHVNTPDHPKGVAAQRFADLVYERSGGRIKIEVYPSSQLYDDLHSVEALQAGNIHFIAPYSGKLTGYAPAFQLLQFPFLFPTPEDFYRFSDGELGQRLLDKLENIGLKGLAYWDNGFMQLINSKRPIRTVEDFKGLKFRIPGGKITEAQYKLFGASAITLPFSEVYAALQQGTVDGLENTFTNIETMKFYEVTKYLTISNHSYLGYIVITNKDWWEGLPDDIRTILADALQEVSQWQREKARESEHASLEKLKQTKLEIIELSPEERAKMREAVLPLYEEFEDVVGKELLEDVIKMVQQ
ncbi:DctP family TRAP transporter solute-binding subunit [Calderihabitans maritimus]|uniref:TRAP dicarboxylate transporter subunit DctP n=1 Tax=Calderihabitans maritimus TaxID=1246530 RepID=A0A1Z5HTY8_9FIRM|nr:DctP family TRAP transporter solute-binding subunit [Calderihabitans maritimus]GAW92807.1 TRAP dicarboxylate transporter subunit DctP [Calderihabitans maritimus]